MIVHKIYFLTVRCKILRSPQIHFECGLNIIGEKSDNRYPSGLNLPSRFLRIGMQDSVASTLF
jgi:hypothetical protein